MRHRLCRDGQVLLHLVVRVRLGPRDDEGHSQAALKPRTLFIPERSVRRPGAAIVGKKDDKCLFGHAKLIEFIHHIAKRFIHPLHESGKRKTVPLQCGIVFDKACVRILPGRVYRVVTHVGEERFSGVHRGFNRLVHLKGDRLGQEEIGSVIFLQPGNIPNMFPCAMIGRVVVFPPVTAGATATETRYVDIKPEVRRVA